MNVYFNASLMGNSFPSCRFGTSSSVSLAWELMRTLLLKTTCHRGLFWLLRAFWSREVEIVHDGMSLQNMKWSSFSTVMSAISQYVCNLQGGAAGGLFWFPRRNCSWFLKVRGSWLLMAQWFMARGFWRLVVHFSRLVDCSGFCDPDEAEMPK